MGDNIPAGKVTVQGIILDSKVDNLDSGKISCTVLTKDPYTGESIRLDNVSLKQNNPAIPDTIDDNQKVTVTAPSYDAYRRRNTVAISAMVAPEEVKATNAALPDHVKVKSKIDAFSSRPTAMCKSFQDKANDLNEKMGLIYKRKDLTTIQGTDKGASPSFIIHQGNGDVCMVDGTGKQYVNVNVQKGIALQAGQVDMGSAKQCKNSLAYGGQSGYENPVGDVVPQGTIVSPHPKFLPNITKIVNTILPILDMIDLGKACFEAYKVIYDASTDKEKRKGMEKIQNLEQNNTTEDIAAKRAAT